MSLLMAGYWPTTYWSDGYWDENYWPGFTTDVYFLRAFDAIDKIFSFTAVKG